MKQTHLKKYIKIVISLALLVGSSLACGESTNERTVSVDEETVVSETVDSELSVIVGETNTEPNQTKDSTNSDGDTWTVMLYQDADDSVLEEDVFTDLNEAEKIGSTDTVNIVAEIDRYSDGYTGEQDFSGAKRFYLTQDDNLEVINSEEVDDLGEVNMADGAVLVDFVTWAIQTYPADHYALILSDHGTGWPGGWTDEDVKSKAKDILIDGFDDMLYLNEMVDALSSIQEQTGLDRFELIGFDACLMGSLEVFTSVQPFAHYAVASQETEPSMGWAYTAFLKELTSNPGMDTGILAKDIVTSYIAEDTLIVDDEARASYLERTYESGDDMSVTQLIEEETKTVTLAAIDLDQLQGVNDALNTLVLAMGKINQKMVARARTHTRSFESVYGEGYPSPYLDLGNFIKQIKKESTSPNITSAADALSASIKKAVIAEKHGESKKGSTGISIYFPNSSLFESAGSDYATYTNIADTFSKISLWDDFLTFHYTGQEIQANNKPKEDTAMVGPGAGGITLDPVELSADTALVENPVTLSTTVNGENVSYIYLFVGQYNEDETAIQIVDIDYIDADDTFEIDGLVYPDWGGNEIPIELDWEPTQFVLDDGEYYLPVLLEPDTYGVEMADTIYSVDGLYLFADGEPNRYARLFFNGDGELIQVMGFSGEDDSGPQHEITPVEDDQVSIYSQSISLEEDNTGILLTESGTLTFGEIAWTWESMDADPGEYVIGIIVEDMDGNTYEEYAPLGVE